MSAREIGLIVGSISLVALVGCLSFVEPQRERGRLGVALDLRDADPAEAELRATFSPEIEGEGPTLTAGGSAASGPSAIRILGRTLSPSRDHANGVLEYRSSWTPTEDDLARARVELEGPRPGSGGPRVHLSAPLVWRAGPESIRLGAGEDLELALRGAPVEVSESDSVRITWQLQVRDPQDAQRVYSVRSTGVLPDTLRVERRLLETVPVVDPLEARLHVDITVEASPGADYDAWLHTSFDLRWRITAATEASAHRRRADAGAAETGG